MTVTSTPRLATGLADPVFGSQVIFRRLLDAMSAPGHLFEIPDDLAGTPPHLPVAAAAILLTLADYETPVDLLPDEPETRHWLAFHTGAPKASSPAEARFSVMSASLCRPLADLNPGDDRYPDTSTTVLLLCESLSGGLPVTLTGPGLQTATLFAPRGIAPALWREIADNNAHFPLGVDVIFVAGSTFAALPRSTIPMGAF